MAFPRIQNSPVLILYLLSIAYAIVLPQSTTKISAGRRVAITRTITQSSKWPPNDQLQKRQLPGYVCGYIEADPTFSVTCTDHYQYCQGEILLNGAAYAVCVTQLDQQLATVFTTAYPYPGSVIYPCPLSAICCPDFNPFVEVDLYIESGYTVTGFDCVAEPTTAILIPNSNVLNPSFYSHWLATHGDITTPPATSSSSSSYVRHSRTTKQSKPNSTPSGSNQSSPPQQSATSKNSSGGLSESNKIALGVGIGVGLPATIATIIMCWRGPRVRN